MKSFPSHVVSAIFVIGILTFLLGLLLQAFGGQIFGQVSADHDSFSRSLVGHRGLVEFLRQTGTTVVVSRTVGLAMDEGRFPLLLLEPEPSADAEIDPTPAEEAESVRRIVAAARRTGTTLVVALPKYRAVASRSKEGFVRLLRLLTVDEIAAMPFWGEILPDHDGSVLTRHDRLRGILARTLAGPAVDLGPNPQVLAPVCFEEIFVGSDEGVLVGKLRTGDDGPEIVLVSDPGLINNQGLARGDHAVILHSLIRDRLDATAVIVDETVHGFRASSSVLERFFTFPYAIVLIQVVLAAALLAWAGAVRFGRELTPPPVLPPGKALLLDNTSRLLLAAGSHGESLRRYLRVVITDVAERFYLTGGARPEDLIPRLETLSRTSGVACTLSRVEKRARGRDLNPGAAVRLAREIHRWRRQIMETSSLKED